MTKTRIAVGLIFIACMPALSGEPPADVNVPQYSEPSVRIMLTQFHITDQNLSVEWNIRNETDHNIWYCRGFGPGEALEDYLAEESSTLMVRSRLDVPTDWTWSQIPFGTYVRLKPGEEAHESYSRSLPIQGRGLFAAGRTPETEQIKRLIVEIGFYNEDLPELIREILEVAERFGGEEIIEFDLDSIIGRFFRGLMVLRKFGSLSSFNDLFSETISQGVLPINYSFQMFSGEQVLRLEVDGIDIPFKR